MAIVVRRISFALAIICLALIPLDFWLHFGTAISNSHLRFLLHLALAWVFAVLHVLSQRRPIRAPVPIKQLVCHVIHRASFLLAVVCLCMIPIGIVVEGNEWGRMSDGFEGGYFVNAWLYALVSHWTRPHLPNASPSEDTQRPI